MLRHTLSIGLALALLAAVPLPAQQQGDEKGGSRTWTGALADANCKARTPADACEVTASTGSYGIVLSDGKFAKFDSQGNSLVAAQLRGKQGKVTAKVTGKLSGDAIQVEQVQIE